MNEAIHAGEARDLRVNLSIETHQRALALAADRLGKIKQQIDSAVRCRDAAERRLRDFENRLEELEADLVLYTRHLNALQGVAQ